MVDALATCGVHTASDGAGACDDDALRAKTLTLARLWVRAASVGVAGGAAGASARVGWS